jgi:hypothetical protein
MKSLLSLVPTYLRDSYHVLKELRELKELPPNAKLFTFDAARLSMYTNINTPHGIDTFSKWLTDFKDEICTDFPKTLFLKVLEKVMSENVFQFDNLFFQQARGRHCHGY